MTEHPPAPCTRHPVAAVKATRPPYLRTGCGRRPAKTPEPAGPFADAGGNATFEGILQDGQL